MCIPSLSLRRLCLDVLLSTPASSPRAASVSILKANWYYAPHDLTAVARSPENRNLHLTLSRSVKFHEKDALPRAQYQASAGKRHKQGMTDQRRLDVGVGIALRVLIWVVSRHEPV